MAAQLPTFEPDSLTAGDTASWTKCLGKYPAGEGWTLSYAFIKRSAAGSDEPIKFNATASGNDYLVNVAPGLTVQWQPGAYSGQAYVALGADRFMVWEGLLTILPNFAAGGVGDIRTHARKVLDSIEAVLEKRGTQEILEWTVEGVQLRKATVADLMMLRDRYKAIVQKEEARDRIRAGKASGRRILTKFTRPGSQQTWPPGFVRS